jgi:hypothetical protein
VAVLRRAHAASHLRGQRFGDAMEAKLRHSSNNRRPR